MTYKEVEQAVYRAIGAAKDAGYKETKYYGFVYEDIKVMLRTQRFSVEEVPQANKLIISW